MNLLELYKNNNDVVVSPSDNGELFIIKYKHLGVNWANEYTRKARGLIVDRAGNVVARPFEKFFNVNELNLPHHADLPADVKQLSAFEDLPFEATEKLDGSLVIGFTYNDEFITASSGSLNSEHARVFADFVHNEYAHVLKELTELGRTNTIMFEYTAPTNVIVLHYEETSMRVIGMNETHSGRSYSNKELNEIFGPLGIPVVNLLPLNTLEDIQDYIDNEKNIEGIVIRYENGKQLKLKTSEYVSLHKAVGQLDNKDGSALKNYQVVVNYLLNGKEGDLDDILVSPGFMYASKLWKDSFAELRATVMHKVDAYNVFAMNADEILAQVEGVKLWQLNLEDPVASFGDYVYSRGFVENFRRELRSFRSDREEYQAIMGAVGKSRRKRALLESLRGVYGNAVNYPNEISVNSFAHKEFSLEGYLVSAEHNYLNRSL